MITFRDVQAVFVKRYCLDAASAAEGAKSFLDDYRVLSSPRPKTIPELQSVLTQYEDGV